MTREDLDRLLEAQLGRCTPEQRTLYSETRIEPARWRQDPWGESHGFWAVAVSGDRVLWYNEIEEGFNVSSFSVRGEIPQKEYWCNQDALHQAIPRLQGDLGIRVGAPQSIPWPLEPGE